MKRNLSLILLVLFCSCASARPKWREVSPPFSGQTWRICVEEYDGSEKHLKGFCYISKECKNRFIIKDKCRPLPKFISFSDEAGVLRIINSGKVLKKR